MFLTVPPYQAPAPVDRYQTTLFSWIDSLGFENDLKKPFVRVSNLGEQGMDGKWPLSYGFLLADRGDSFDVLIPNLSVRTYYKSNARICGAYAPADFRTFVDGYLDTKYKFLSDYNFAVNPDPSVGRGFEPTLAWICRQKVLVKESQDLMKSSSVEVSNEADERTNAKILGMEDAIAEGVYSDLILRFEDARESRRDLLTRFNSFPPVFGGTRAAKDASGLIDSLGKMCEEDRVRKSGSEGAADQSRQDRISGLIWSLRNYNRRAIDRNLTPVDLLISVGSPAVPQLLDALRDQRFTRTVGHPMTGPERQFGKNSIERVRDLAQFALEQIAHRKFIGADYDDYPGIEKSARNWWTEMSSKGEEAYLIESVKHGSAYSSEQAKRLVEAYPRVALNAIKVGVHNALDPNVRGDLIRALQGVSTDETIAFARQIVANDKDFEPRMAATQILAVRDPNAAITIAEKELKRTARLPDRFENKELIWFLVGSESPWAIRSLSGELRTMNPADRVAVLTCYFGGTNPIGFASKRTAESSPEVRKKIDLAVEDLLAKELEDRDRSLGSMTVNNHSFVSPELSEVAEYSLAQCFSNKYTFAQPSSNFEKDRLRVKNLNVYRLSRGLAPEPEPKLPPSQFKPIS